MRASRTMGRWLIDRLKDFQTLKLIDRVKSLTCSSNGIWLKLLRRLWLIIVATLDHIFI